MKTQTDKELVELAEKYLQTTPKTNKISAVATTDGELIVLADNYGFHVIPASAMFEALKPYNYVTTEFYIHYRLNKESKSHLVSTDMGGNSFYPGQLSDLAQAFANQLWAHFVDGAVSHKPGILEQL